MHNKALWKHVTLYSRSSVHVSTPNITSPDKMSLYSGVRLYECKPTLSDLFYRHDVELFQSLETTCWGHWSKRGFSITFLSSLWHTFFHLRNVTRIWWSITRLSQHYQIARLVLKEKGNMSCPCYNESDIWIWQAYMSIKLKCAEYRPQRLIIPILLSN